MNWIKQNPFITGLIGALVVLIGVFGFLLVQEQTSYADISDKFVSQSKEAARLQALKPYPDKSNLEKATAEKDVYKDKIENLQKQLIGYNLPLTPISVVDFVAKLRDYNAAVVEAAAARNVRLPAENFYMGFEKYQTSPPSEKATSRMFQQLEAINTVLRMLIQKSITELKTLKRDEIPEETGGTADSGLVTKTKFLIEFRADHEKVRDILNTLVKMDKPFLVIRNLRLLNDVVDTIPRVAATPANTVPDPATPPPSDAVAAAAMDSPNPPVPATATSITTLAGTERITVSLEIEILTFGEGKAPEAAPTAGQKPPAGGRQRR